MSKEFAQKIKKLRLAKKYSQEFIAKKINISRPTYMQIEKGERELNIKEAEILASIFNVSLEDFLKEKEVNIKIKIEGQKKNKKNKIKEEIRISVPQENLLKFKEILLYILGKIGAKPNIGETVIYKLLYFIDFDYYEKYEEQLIGARYIKNHFGPTPVEFKHIVDEMEAEGEIEKVRSKYFQYEQKKYLPHRSPDLSILSGQEIEHINNVLLRLSSKSAKELSEYSHRDVPWKSHEYGEIIDYESVFYRDDKYSVKEQVDEL